MTKKPNSYIALPDYPGYYLNKFGAICYLKDGKYRCCRIVKPKTGLTEIYKETYAGIYKKLLVSSFELSNKYYPDWLTHRSEDFKKVYLKKLTKESNKQANTAKSKAKVITGKKLMSPEKRKHLAELFNTFILNQ